MPENRLVLNFTRPRKMFSVPISDEMMIVAWIYLMLSSRITATRDSQECVASPSSMAVTNNWENSVAKLPIGLSVSTMHKLILFIRRHSCMFVISQRSFCAYINLIRVVVTHVSVAASSQRHRSKFTSISVLERRYHSSEAIHHDTRQNENYEHSSEEVSSMDQTQFSLKFRCTWFQA